MGKLLDVSAEEFKKVIDSEENIVVVDFWANWCIPCKTLGPILDELSKEIEDLTVIKLNVDDKENLALASEIGVRNIPAVFLYKKGEIVDKFVGLKDKKGIESIIEKNR